MPVKSEWWVKYADSEKAVKNVVDQLLEMVKKIEDKWWEKQWKILEEHGHGHIGHLPKHYRDRFWALQAECDTQTRPLLRDVVKICNYWLDKKHGRI